jgi:hypothetical protein
MTWWTYFSKCFLHFICILLLKTKKSLFFNDLLKEHKPWFHEECSKLLDQSKEANLKWLQNPSQMSGNALDLLVTYLGKILNGLSVILTGFSTQIPYQI